MCCVEAWRECRNDEMNGLNPISTTTTTAQLAQVIACTEAEGPGKRLAIWFQGCPLRCQGCCNPEYLPTAGGQTWELPALLQFIENTRETQPIQGISLLGGEPFMQPHAALAVAQTAKALGLSVMIYSGYTLEQLQAMLDPTVQELLWQTDVLVDGPYLREQPERARRWVGSTNQRVHFLSNHYRASDPCWRAANTLEIRYDGSSLCVNGFPAEGAKMLWQRPPKPVAGRL
jgi:anaerobic ribonucleoside-triphosphate reductase activating protein